MILTNKKIQEIISQVVGDDAIPIIRYLRDRKNVSEFKIADNVKYDMQKTRNLLYRLNSHNVATYIRKKDRAKGWYISYWTFNRKSVKDLISKIKKDRMTQLMERLQKEEESAGHFYICTKACARLDFDQATEFSFKCPECGSLLNMQENIKTIKNLRKRIKEIEFAKA